MPRYAGSLRELMGNVHPSDVTQLFSQILDGVEAAHLKGVTHRDLKPENILCDGASRSLAVADFGIASFTADALLTAVETAPGQRLANFQYAAPEQRERGREIAATADIYALGLMLIEMFTGFLTLTLDRPVTNEWEDALHNIGNYSSVVGAKPRMVRFDGSGRTCRMPASEGSAKHVINYFKTWLPAATQKLRQVLAERARHEEVLLQEKLRTEREEEERLLRVNQKLVI